jgi:hypothetical protein
MLAMRMVFFMIPGVGFARRAWRVMGIPGIISGGITRGITRGPWRYPWGIA